MHIGLLKGHRKFHQGLGFFLEIDFFLGHALAGNLHGYPGLGQLSCSDIFDSTEDKAFLLRPNQLTGRLHLGHGQVFRFTLSHLDPLELHPGAQCPGFTQLI